MSAHTHGLYDSEIHFIADSMIVCKYTCALYQLLQFINLLKPVTEEHMIISCLSVFHTITNTEYSLYNPSIHLATDTAIINLYASIYYTHASIYCTHATVSDMLS